MQANRKYPFRRTCAGLLALGLGLAGVPASALGLADVTLQSHLGQALRATVALVGAESDDALRGCVRARLQSVDGGGVINAAVAPVRSGAGFALLVTTTQKVVEPAVTLTIEMTCDGRTQREYSLLLDPLEWQQADAPRTPVTMPITAAPVAQGVTIPAGGLPSRAAVQAARQPAHPAARAPAQRAAVPSAALLKSRNAKLDAAKAEAPKDGAANVDARQAELAKGEAVKTAPPPKRAANPEAPQLLASAPARPAAAVQARNVLRLSTAGDAPVTAADEETAARLKAVQAKLLALESQALAAEQPAAKTASAEPAVFTGSIDDTEQKLKEVQARIRALQIETKNISAQELPQTKRVLPQPSPSVAVPAAAPQTDSALQTALAVLLAVAVAVIVALVLRMRQMKKYRDALDSF
jgi:hypothetical protein